MKYISLLLALFLVNELTAQSGWVKKKNDLYAQVNYIGFQSDNYFSIFGDQVTTAKFKQNTVGLYAEYGLGKRFALEYNHVLYRWNSVETTETVSGFGDLFVGVKYGILDGKIPLAIIVGPELPIGNAALISRNKSDPNTFLFLPTGDGEWNFLTTLAASHPIKGLPAYISMYTTFNYRTNYKSSNFSHQLRSGVEIGFQPLNGLWLQTKVRTYLSLGDPEPGIDFIRGEGTEFTVFEFGGSYEFIKSWMIVGSVATYSDLIVSRKNLYSSPNFSIGVAYKRE